MKVTCLQENLSRGLGIVGRAVASRTTLPITNNVLLATDGGRLKLVATNLEVAIVHWIGAKVEEEGSITVPARVFSEFVNSLPNDNVEMELIQASRSLQVKCARFEARLSGADEPEPVLDRPAAGRKSTVKYWQPDEEDEYEEAQLIEDDDDDDDDDDYEEVGAVLDD